MVIIKELSLNFNTIVYSDYVVSNSESYTKNVAYTTLVIDETIDSTHTIYFSKFRSITFNNIVFRNEIGYDTTFIF